MNLPSTEEILRENENLRRENQLLRDQLATIHELVSKVSSFSQLPLTTVTAPSSSSTTTTSSTTTSCSEKPTFDPVPTLHNEKGGPPRRSNSFQITPIFENDKVVSIVAIHKPVPKKKHKKKSSQLNTQSASSSGLSTPTVKHKEKHNKQSNTTSSPVSPINSNNSFSSPYGNSMDVINPDLPVIAAAEEFRQFQQKRKRHRKKARPVISAATDVQAILDQGDSIVSDFLKESLDTTELMEITTDLKQCCERILKHLQGIGLKVTTVHEAETLESLLEKNLSTEYSAFYLVNISAVIEKYLEHKHFLPRAIPHYAIKSNPDIALVHTLRVLGAGFDCASMAELEEALSVGASPEMIIFANPTKGKEHIQFAKDKGIKKMTFDNEEELKKIQKIFPDAELVLRALPESHSNSSIDLGLKFGATFEEAVNLIVLAKKLNLNLIGVSFHVGSNCFSTDSYVQALKLARALFDVAIETGFKMTLLDIGGGFPGTNSGVLTFPEIASTVGALIDHLFDEDVRVISEPGRFFCTASYTLAVNIISKRERYVKKQLSLPSPVNVNNGETVASEPENELEVLYYLSDGIYGSFNNVIFDHAHPNPNQVIQRTGEAKKSKLFGPTCDSLDVICDVELPTLEVGDWLYFTNMGAYTISSATHFNGFMPPNAHYFIDLS